MRFSLKQIRALLSCFDAFSSRETHFHHRIKSKRMLRSKSLWQTHDSSAGFCLKSEDSNPSHVQREFQIAGTGENSRSPGVSVARRSY
jgi:hypothetical protein